MRYLGKTPAVLAIRAYRRWVAGRGPLRRVCCTFAATESCSAYGLRAARDLARSLPEAVRLVRARLHACRRTSIYRFAPGLGWERDHELPPGELARVLAARGERPDTIAQVLAARTLVARWRGERDAYAVGKRHAAAPRIPVRGGDAAIAYHRRAMWRGVVLAMLAATLFVLAGWVVVLPCLVAAASAAGARGAAKRLERQRVAAKFLRPAAS